METFNFELYFKILVNLLKIDDLLFTRFICNFQRKEFKKIINSYFISLNYYLKSNYQIFREKCFSNYYLNHFSFIIINFLLFLMGFCYSYTTQIKTVFLAFKSTSMD